MMHDWGGDEGWAQEAREDFEFERDGTYDRMDQDEITEDEKDEWRHDRS